MSYPYLARTILKYKSPHATDLSFLKGETIRVTGPSPDDEDWLVGETLDGERQGGFPKDFVEEVEETAEHVAPTLPATSVASEAETAHVVEKEPAAAISADAETEAVREIPETLKAAETPATPVAAPATVPVPAPAVSTAPVQQSPATPAGTASKGNDSPPKPSSFRDRIAAFNVSKASGPPPAVKPKPAATGLTWSQRQKLRQEQEAAEAAANGGAAPAPASAAPTPAAAAEPTSTPTTKSVEGASGMSASDAQSSISKGGSLKERMAALAGAGAFGSPAEPAPPVPAGKPKVWSRPVVTSPPATEDDEPSLEAPDAAAATEEGAAEGDKQEVADGEEAPEKDEEAQEKARRAAIAARMAKLGARGPMGMPPPKPAAKKSSADVPSSPAQETAPAVTESEAQPEALSAAPQSIKMPAIARRAAPPRRARGAASASAASSPSTEQPPFEDPPPQVPSQEIPLPKTHQQIAEEKAAEELGRGEHGADGALAAGIALAPVASAVVGSNQDDLPEERATADESILTAAGGSEIRDLSQPTQVDDFDEDEDDEDEVDLMKQAKQGDLDVRVHDDNEDEEEPQNPTSPVAVVPLHDPAEDTPHSPEQSRDVTTSPTAPSRLLGLPKDEVELKHDAATGTSPQKPAGPRALPPSLSAAPPPPSRPVLPPSPSPATMSEDEDGQEDEDEAPAPPPRPSGALPPPPPGNSAVPPRDEDEDERELESDGDVEPVAVRKGEDEAPPPPPPRSLPVPPPSAVMLPHQAREGEEDDEALAPPPRPSGSLPPLPPLQRDESGDDAEAPPPPPPRSLPHPSAAPSREPSQSATAETAASPAPQRKPSLRPVQTAPLHQQSPVITSPSSPKIAQSPSMTQPPLGQTAAEDDEDASRRQGIAARMAKLGGIKFGMPPPVFKKASGSSADRDDPTSPIDREAPIETPISPIRESAPSPSPVPATTAAPADDDESEEGQVARRAATLARLRAGGSLGFGMFGAPAPTGPAPSEDASGKQITSTGLEASVQEQQLEDDEDDDEAPPLPPPRPSAPSSPVALKRPEPIATSSDRALPPLGDAAPPSPARKDSMSKRPPVPAQRQSVDVKRSSSTNVPLVAPVRANPLPQSPERGSLDLANEPAVMMMDEPEEEAPPPPPPRPMQSAPPPTSAAVPTVAPPLELPSTASPVAPTHQRSASMASQSSARSTPQRSASVRQPSMDQQPRQSMNQQRPAYNDLQQAAHQQGMGVYRAAKSLFDQGRKANFGDGSPAGFVFTVFNQAQLPPPHQSWGQLVFEQESGSVLKRYDEPRPGDVVAFHDARFKGKKGLSSYQQHVGSVEEPLVAIASEFEQKKHKLRALQVDRGAPEEVSYRFDDLKSGRILVYRPGI